MEKIETTPASTVYRFMALIMDMLFVHIIRFFYVNLSIKFWLIGYIKEFVKKYHLLYGEFNSSKITQIEINFFFKSDLFRELILFIMGMFVISFLYNFILLSTKWSATIGQRIMGLKVVRFNGNKIGFLNTIFRSFLIIIPWIFITTFIINEFLAQNNITIPVGKITFLISFIIFISWYDLVFFTKEKLTFHDYISFTKVVKRTPDLIKKEQNKLYKLFFAGSNNLIIKTFAYSKDVTKKLFNILKQILNKIFQKNK